MDLSNLIRIRSDSKGQIRGSCNRLKLVKKSGFQYVMGFIRSSLNCNVFEADEILLSTESLELRRRCKVHPLFFTSSNRLQLPRRWGIPQVGNRRNPYRKGIFSLENISPNHKNSIYNEICGSISETAYHAAILNPLIIIDCNSQ